MLTAAILQRLAMQADSVDQPIEADLWDVERLERHGRSLAESSGAFADRERLDLAERLRSNAQALESAYEAIATALRAGRAITPAAQWLVDNFHVITEQLTDVPLRLTPRVWRHLPAADHADAVGWPRVFHIATEYLRHTLWEFNPESLARLLKGYQDATPLKMRELWLLYPILRIVLIDELVCIAMRVEESLAARAAADQLADLLVSESTAEPDGYDPLRSLWMEGPIIASYIVQLAHRLHGMGERGRPLLDGLSQELARRGTTIDDYIQRQHARRSANNLAARNIITSLRALTSFDWRSLFEKTSQVELLLRAEPTYINCDRRTRDRYRSCIEELATATMQHETTITQSVLALLTLQHDLGPQATDLGSWLIGPRRLELEAALSFPSSLSHRVRRGVVRQARLLYLGGIAAVTLLLTAVAIHVGTDWQAGLHPLLCLLAVLALFPLSEVAIAFLNRQWIRAFPPRHLPRLALETGLRDGMKTLVVVPTLLCTPQDAALACRQLQIHALANSDPLIHFALLSDWSDSASEAAPGDDIVLAAARDAIAALNRSMPVAAGNDARFFLLHRRRLWSSGEGCFMGWERKRGKLEELNRLLLNHGITSFLPDAEGVLAVPSGISYVLTVDADTRLPMGCVKDLVGIAAHPLNRPEISAERRVIQGYGVLQPRITPLLPSTEERSLYREIVTSGSGVDPYAAAVSDLNQDVFEEGLFTGKGLYDLRAWEATVGHRAPVNTLLSHDLFEGLFARCGLVTDIELFEDFPSHSEVAAARSHRWIRGDWQLLPWIAGLRGRLPPLGRWKMLDNLRRSLAAPCSVALLVAAFADNAAHPLVWLIVVLGPWLWPALSTAFVRLLRWPVAGSLRVHFRRLAADLLHDLLRGAVSLALLAQNAWLSVDAISRAVFRLTISRRHLLEWITAAQLKAVSDSALITFVWPLKSASIVIVASAAALLAANPQSFNAFVPFLVLWWLSPVLAQLISRPLDAQQPDDEIPDDVEAELRAVARLTWTFFERFVTAEDNFLPPDNFQEDPAPVVAHRSSPTNFGLYLLACVSARDFGWLGLQDLVGRLNATLASLHKLERFDGHFLNWYDTRTLAPLLPRYVSTVDSGNLAGHLLTLRQACFELRHGPLLSARAFSGALDALSQCRSALAATPEAGFTTARERREMHVALEHIQLGLGREGATLAAGRSTLQAAVQDIERLVQHTAVTMPANVTRWLRIAAGDLQSHLRDLQLLVPVPSPTALEPDEYDLVQSLESALDKHATLEDAARYLQKLQVAVQPNAGVPEVARVRAPWITATAGGLTQCATLMTALDDIAARCEAMVAEMSFGFLFDRTRGLFSIGYRVTDQTLDAGYYDLLASEARLASLVAIAKGDAPRSHWLRLGRRLTGGSQRPVLASWSGSMFEYLMPALVMQEPRYSLLEQSNQRAVEEQIRYGERHSLPWGISESAYNVRDREYTYQYSSFGLPSLGLKRGLAADYVVAPYATALAAMFRPVEACENYRLLAKAAGQGEFGF
ncbi:MAG: glucoamylase family protein, partial [Steroidobacteraceae bacterium]